MEVISCFLVCLSCYPHIDLIFLSKPNFQETIHYEGCSLTIFSTLIGIMWEGMFSEDSQFEKNATFEVFLFVCYVFLWSHHIYSSPPLPDFEKTLPYRGAASPCSPKLLEIFWGWIMMGQIICMGGNLVHRKSVYIYEC